MKTIRGWLLVFLAFGFGWKCCTLYPSQDAKRWIQIRDHMSIQLLKWPTGAKQWYVRDRMIPCRDNGESFQQSVDEEISRIQRWKGEQ